MRETMKQRAIPRICLLALVLLLTFSASSRATPTAVGVKRVLVLHSFHHGYIWTDRVQQGIEEAFRQSDLPIEPYQTFMDLKRVPLSDDYLHNFKNLLQEGYKTIPFDAILASDNDALEFLRRYRDELFPGVPVVFSAINDFEVSMLDGRHDITGLPENTNYTATINLALKVRPAAKNMVVVTDNTTTGRAHHSAVQKIEPLFSNKLRFQYLSVGDFTHDEVVEKLAALKDDSVVLLLHHFLDKNGVSQPVQTSTPLLTSRCPVPCFVVADTRVGLGALGGNVVSAYHYGQAAARLVLEILHGADISTIPVRPGPNQNMFDFKVLNRFHVAEKDLPAGSMVINRPATIFSQYRYQIIVTVLALTILLGIVVVMSFEIRRRRQVEKSLRQSEERFALAMRGANDGLWDWDLSTDAVYLSPRWKSMLGYDPPELEHTLDTWKRLVHPEDQARTLAEVKSLVEGQSDKFEVEFRMRHKDGSFRHILSRGFLVNDAEGRPRRLVGTHVDISERKRAEEELQESEEKFRNIVQMSPVAKHFYRLDADDQLILFGANPSADLMTGTDHSTLVGKTIEEAFPGLVSTDIPAMYRRVARGELEPQSFEMPYDDGTVQGVFDVRVFRTSDRTIVVDFLEISERKRAENQIKQNLQEKEILLKEIHHRVKNNMAVISSLLSLQADRIEDSVLKGMFDESRQRIFSMAMIHEKLYRTEDLSSIDFHDYLNSIVQELVAAYNQEGKVIVTKINAHGVLLDIDTATPCGLIINELITNVLKYAFPEQKSGELDISVIKTGQTYTLTIKDNGVGLPATFDHSKSNTLGLQLIEALVGQLRGTLQFNSDAAIQPGTEVIVTFTEKDRKAQT